MKTSRLRVNEMIRVPEIRVIDEKGSQVGIIRTQEALSIAREKNLDLVEVAPQSRPPVCRFLDYGKFRFETEKKLRESRKKQKNVVLKEVRMQPKISSHDLDFKVRLIRNFLQEGHKVKTSIRFRGREMAHRELGVLLLKRIESQLGPDIRREKDVSMEGRMMSMILIPSLRKENDKKGEDVHAKD